MSYNFGKFEEILSSVLYMNPNPKGENGPQANKSKVCLNCGTQTREGNFCHICGQPVDTGRLTTANLGLNILSGVTRINNRFLFTYKNLLFRPWRVISEYISGRRVSYVGPVQLLIVLVFISLALPALFGIERSNMPEEFSRFNFLADDNAAFRLINYVIRFILSSLVLLYILLLVPVVPIVRIFHRILGIKKYNLAEYIVGALYMSSFILVVNVTIRILEIFLKFCGVEFPVVTMILTTAIVIGMFFLTFYRSMSASKRSSFAKIGAVFFVFISCIIVYALLFLLVGLIHNYSFGRFS